MRAGIVALGALLALPLLAGSSVTVEQLAETLASAHASRRTDDETARKIAGVELRQRLTEATLSRLCRNEGERTMDALRVLADESAFLDPPASEMPSGGPPDLAEQKAIFARAGDYALAYMHNLPNFRCTQTTRRLDDDPLSARRHKADVVGRLHEHDTIVSELTYSNGAELRHVRTVNGQVWRNEEPIEGLTTRGEFGSIMGSIFRSSAAAKAVWNHWETLDGKRLAVFDYSVDRAHSNLEITWCCDARSRGWRRVTAEYRGVLSIEPASGAIFRVTRRAVNIPAGFPTRTADAFVEYRTVDVGGKSWLCPTRSVTISQIVRVNATTGAMGVTTADGGTNSGTGVDPWLHELNEVEFTDYHKFESESRMVTGDDPPAEDKPAVSTQPIVPAEGLPTPASPAHKNP
jgi:hypothetical protein